jgi:hypothetical protein
VFVARKDAACGEGLRNPSCTDMSFKLPGSLQQRTTAFLHTARGHGWRIFRHCVFPYNSYVNYKLDRGPFTANVTFGTGYRRSDSMEVLAYHDHGSTAHAKLCPP